MTDQLCPGCPGDPNETCCKPELRVKVWMDKQKADMTDQKTDQKPAWRKSDTWRRMGKDFTVEVYHYIAPGPESYDDGRYRWYVYAYVYPNHPHFKNFSGPAMWQDAATAMPFHGGPSFLRWFYDDDGKPVSVKVGSDYHHLHDDSYSFVKTEAEAFGIFDDADQLFDWLAARTQEAA